VQRSACQPDRRLRKGTYGDRAIPANFHLSHWADSVETGKRRLDALDPIVALAPACGELARDSALLAALAALYGEPACLFKDKLILQAARSERLRPAPG